MLCSPQLDLADQWIVTPGTGTARQHETHLLHILDAFFADENGSFKLLYREDMAAMTGIAVKTVSRVVTDFKRKKFFIQN